MACDYDEIIKKVYDFPFDCSIERMDMTIFKSLLDNFNLSPLSMIYKKIVLIGNNLQRDCFYRAKPS